MCVKACRLFPPSFSKLGLAQISDLSVPNSASPPGLFLWPCSFQIKDKGKRRNAAGHLQLACLAM